MRIRFVPFEKLPYCDTCWSLIEGPDDRVYAAACCEHASGGTVVVVRYDPQTEELVYLLDVAEAVGQPPDDGRATQCKIHYSMVIDDDGILYGATHLSGPAVTEVHYNPWATFDDPLRSFVGSKIFAYDIAAEKVLWTDTLIEWEGCRCLALDAPRRRLYAAGYPRNHFYIYDLDRHTTTDLGRFGSVNPQAIWTDGRMRAWTTGDYGELVVCDPNEDELKTTDLSLPHAPYQDGWHNVIYDVVGAPDGGDVFGAPWNMDPYIFRFRPGASPEATEVTSLGAAIRDVTPTGVNSHHVGGLVFSAGGDLLYTTTRVGEAAGDKRYHRLSTLRLMDVRTGDIRTLCDLIDENGMGISYVSRTARIGPQHLVMGAVGHTPTGICHVTLDDDLAEGPFAKTPRRYWG